MKTKLSEQARRFSFFQVVDLIERFYRPEAKVGFRGPTSREIIRFRPEASLAFPRSDIALLEEFSDKEGRERYRITTTFLGLYGTVSPLPLFYTEELLWADPEKSRVRDFLDIFHHRLLSLFYRAWVKYRYTCQFEQHGNDDFSRRMFCLIGLGTWGLAQSTGVDSVGLIRFAGLLNQSPRSACAIEGVLSSLLGNLPVRIEQCTGHWVNIGTDQRNLLGRANSKLGRNCSIGSRSYSRSGSFRICIGPLSYDNFVQFLPSEKNFRTLLLLVRFLVMDHLDFDLELSVRHHEVPRVRLTSTTPARMASRLGWTSWINSSSHSPDCTCTRNNSLVLRGDFKSGKRS